MGIALALVVCTVCSLPDWAQGAKPKPAVWMCPPSHEGGRALRELFERPEQWAQTRSAIDVLSYADHVLNRQFGDDELKQWFSMLQAWKLKFAMEVGAVKPWGTTGEKVFAAQRPMWDRFQRLGASIHAIALDEPLVCTRMHIKKPDEYAVRETASFIALVRKHYPQMLIGDIEAYPSIPMADHFRWIEALQQRLAELKVRGLDFYRLDVDWVTYTLRNEGSWRDVKKLELYCRSRKLPFSLIYWASGYPALKQRGLADDSTWYVAVMQQGYDYALVDGAPDQYVIESWIEAPSRAVPESDDFTFTRSVRDFCGTFVKPAP